MSKLTQLSALLNKSPKRIQLKSGYKIASGVSDNPANFDSKNQGQVTAARPTYCVAVEDFE